MQGRGRRGQAHAPAALPAAGVRLSFSNRPQPHTPCTRPPPVPQVKIDAGAKAAYVVSGSTWIGTDVPQTLWMKILAAREAGLGGLMVRHPPALAAGPARPWCRACAAPPVWDAAHGHGQATVPPAGIASHLSCLTWPLPAPASPPQLWTADLDDKENTFMNLMKYQQDPGPYPGTVAVSEQAGARCQCAAAG